MTDNHEIAITCDLTSIPAEVRDQHIREGLRIFERVQETREGPDGRLFRFANEPGIVVALARYVEYERLCCPFYHFAIEVEAGSGSIWLRLSGGEGVREFEEAVLADARSAVDRKLINAGADGELQEAVVRSMAVLAEVFGDDAKKNGEGEKSQQISNELA